MKKSASFLLLLSLAFGLTSLPAKSASAMIIVEPITIIAFDPGLTGPAQALGDAAVCILLLPFCILDEKSSGTAGMSKDDLLNNGYSASDADQIAAETRALTAALAAKNEKLTVAKTDTASSVASDIRSVMPSASPLFTQFYTDQLFQ
jgi:hypothetical protein